MLDQLEAGFRELDLKGQCLALDEGLLKRMPNLGCSYLVIEKYGFQILLKCLQSKPVKLLDLLGSICHSSADVVSIRQVSEAARSEVIEEHVEFGHAS